jgi:hypothetical protein
LIYKGKNIMKKAKIVLSAVALFAVVGGALAFKAARIPQTFFYKTNPAATALCTIPTLLPYTTSVNPTTTIPYATTNTTTLCRTGVVAAE